MDAVLRSQTLFHLTGKAPATGLEPIGTADLRPALLARYRELARLRYDFPVVLAVEPDSAALRSLADVVDDLLAEVAPQGLDGESLRKHVLRIEHEIRRLVAQGTAGSLKTVWQQAVSNLTQQAAEPIADVLRHAGDAVATDGELVDCDTVAARRNVTHARRRAAIRSSQRARADLDALIVQLSDILRAEFTRSDAGRQPVALRAGLGARHQELFDFDVLATLLARHGQGERLTPSRRGRIERALEVLRTQRFHAPAPDEPVLASSPAPYEFEFESCAAVLEAFRARRPSMVELIKAVAIAELEVEGRYDEAVHDPLFAAYDEDSLGPEDLQRFPSYLVRLSGAAGTLPEPAALMELLSSGVPAKILVEIDDLLDEASIASGRHAYGVPGAQLASLATTFDDVFVLQSTSSNLYALRDRVAAGLEWPKSTLFSVYTGAGAAADLACYLVSAAAMQSRAFPAFSFDPGAGQQLAARFSLENNPDPSVDWPTTRFEYADRTLTRHEEPLAFTFADFVLCDDRHRRHFARVPPAAWNGQLVPITDWLQSTPSGDAEHVPCVLAVDAANELQKLVVDDRLVQATRRCRDFWHRLQELGGIHNSYATRLLARERAAWEAEREGEREAIDSTAASDVEPQASAAAAAEADPAPAEPERSPDEAWIETSRCSSCNECTQINDRMFAYNENKQAYIRDVSAGTYRELVEAAESCQVAIIHPGKPRDPNEPGIAELLERAQNFL